MVSLGRLYGINNSGDIWRLVSDQSIKTDQRGKVCVCVCVGDGVCGGIGGCEI